MSKKSLQDEISPTVKEIIKKCGGFDECEAFAFCGSVALELLALNLFVTNDEVADEILDNFKSAVKRRFIELKKITEEPKWHQ